MSALPRGSYEPDNKYTSTAIAGRCGFWTNHRRRRRDRHSINYLGGKSLFSEGIMNRFSRIGILLGMLFVVNGSAAIVSAQQKVDPIGTWQLHVNRPGRPANDPLLRLEKAGDKIVGVLTDPQGRSTPVKDVELKGDELSFKITVKREGQELTVNYKAKITGDTLKGNLSLSAFGQLRNIVFEGKRKEDDGTLTGSWKVNLVLESGQKLQPTIRLKQEGAAVSGQYVGNS